MPITRFSEVKPKDLQKLQGIMRYEQARRLLVTIRDSSETKIVLVYHIAKYFCLPENEVMDALK
jgi:hypothetical protein